MWEPGSENEQTFNISMRTAADSERAQTRIRADSQPHTHTISGPVCPTALLKFAMAIREHSNSALLMLNIECFCGSYDRRSRINDDSTCVL